MLFKICPKQNSSEEKHEEIIEKAERHVDLLNEELYDKIKNDGHALIEWKTTLDIIMKEQYNKTKTCDYSLGLEDFFLERVALGFPEGNVWIEQFNDK